MFTVSGQRLLIMLLVSYQLVFQRCGDQFVGELEMGACNSSPIESQIIGERVRLGSFARRCGRDGHRRVEKLDIGSDVHWYERHLRAQPGREQEAKPRHALRAGTLAGA